jgi:membrane-anchored protein YejM (alkaline phosphatase superfamily)
LSPQREKNNFYEESSKVPLLMSFPGVIFPSVVEDSVTHLDVFATVLDYIGATEMDNSDGTSLRPLIEVQSDKINAEYDQGVAIGEWDFRKPLLSDASTLERTIDDRPSFMVRKGSYKLMSKFQNSLLV